MTTTAYTITIIVAALLTLGVALHQGRLDSYDVPVSGLDQPMPPMASSGPPSMLGASRMGR